MEIEKECKGCGVIFEPPSVVLEFAGVDFLFRQVHCDSCIAAVEEKSTSCSRINLEDLLESINSSL